MPGVARDKLVPLTVAVAGAGYIADYHLAILSRVRTAKLVGVCDPSADRMSALADRWGIPHRAATFGELLRVCKPDVLHVLVPPPLHTDLAREALDAGVHVLLEKPMTLSSAECEELLRLAESRGLRVGVNHNAVFHPAMQTLARDLERRRLGKLEHVVSFNNLPLAQLEAGQHDHWMFREPTNVLFEQAPHPLSQICHLLGGVRRAQTLATGKQALRGGRPFWSGWHINLECERGTAQLFLSFGRTCPDQWLHVIGEDGSAHLDLLQNTYRLDRPTQYIEPVDRFVRARRHARGGWSEFLGYCLSTLRLRGRSDVFYRAMRGSIEHFYEQLHGKADGYDSGKGGAAVIAAIEEIGAAADLPAETGPAQLPTRPPAQGDVLVLGGNGFIGQHVVQALAAEGHPVRLLLRRPALLPEKLRATNPAVIAGDATSTERIEEAVAGCKAVVHLIAGAPQDWKGYQELFIDSTRRVAEACLRHGVGQFLYASSIAAYNLGSPSVNVTEDTPLDDQVAWRTDYSRAKILCEQMLQELHREKELPLTTFRPGVVVGAGGFTEHSGVGYWPNRLHCITWGWSIDHPLPFVLAQDVASAIARSVGRMDLAGQSFNLVGDVRLTAREYLDLLRRESGRDIEIHRQSRLWWMLVDYFKWFVKAVARKPGNAFPSYRDLASRSLRSPFDCTRAKKFLGWIPEADRERFIELAVKEPVRGRG